jgi:hypothetical protein
VTEVFGQLANTKFEAWLNAQEAITTKYLREADGIALHRAQGKALFIEEMKKQLTHARTVR